MRNKLGISLVLVVGMAVALVSESALARVVRASEMGGESLQQMFSKNENIIVEFRAGDELPVRLTAEGDLLETKANNQLTYVTVKRNFWVRLNQSGLQISFDGSQFKNISDAVTGSIALGSDADQSGGLANGFNIGFKAFLK